jgi:hypothetical protein
MENETSKNNASNVVEDLENTVSSTNQETAMSDAEKMALQENVSKGKIMLYDMRGTLTPEQTKAKEAEQKQAYKRHEKIRDSQLRGDEMVAEAAIADAEHCKKYGDTSLVRHLFTCLGRTFNVDGLRVWFEKYAPIAIPALVWSKDKGWIPAAPNAQFKLLPKESPRIKRLLEAHNGNVWSIEGMESEPFYQMESFKRQAGERNLKPFTALELWKTVRNAGNKIENAFNPADGNIKRPVDDSYGTQEELEEDFKEIEALCNKLERRAEKRHVERDEEADGKRSGTRLVKKGTTEHKQISNSPSGSAKEEAA